MYITFVFFLSGHLKKRWFDWINLVITLEFVVKLVTKSTVGLIDMGVLIAIHQMSPFISDDYDMANPQMT